MKSYNGLKWFLRVIQRIFIEFSFPAIAATIWYVLTPNSNFQDWGFFFISISWFTGQIFRIVKQQKVEGEFYTVKSQLDSLLGRIEEQTRKLIGYSTGGDSNTFLWPVEHYKEKEIQLLIGNDSDFTCHSIGIRLYEYTQDEKCVLLHEHQPIFYTFHPNALMYSFGYNIPFSDGRRRFKIHHQTRTGCSYVQYIIIHKIEDHYIVAYTKWVNGKIENIIPKEFPIPDHIDRANLFDDLKKKAINA